MVKLAHDIPEGAMTCRPGCGACCIAPSITSPIPGMPGGKPAGVRCVQLTADLRCELYGRPERPAVCIHLEPSIGMCGDSAGQAMDILAALEAETDPGRSGLPSRSSPGNSDPHPSDPTAENP
jgi:hypothetical protein